MYRKCKRVAVVMVTILMMFSILTTGVFAATPYENYTYTEWSTSVPTPESYVPINTYTGSQMGTTNFKEPGDFCFGPDGRLYVLDSGNNRVVVFDSEMKFVKEYTSFTDPKAAGQQQAIVGADGTVLNGSTETTEDSTKVEVKSPSGIYVDRKNFIYVCDTEQSRVLKVDQDGKVVLNYTMPKDTTYSSQIFRPIKITVDENDIAYILSESVYQGALVYDKDGNYMTFYGCPPVQVTAKIILDRMWKKILSKDARSGIAAYVPVEFTSLFMDKKGFIYTCSSYTTQKVEQIRKLNFLGNNIYSFTGNFGEKDIVYEQGKGVYTNFIDICVDDENFVIALDSTRARVYIFDQDGNRLMTFGTIGSQIGTFRTPIAVETKNEKIYVLDKLKNNITEFSLSEYGKLIRNAVELYNSGLYSEAQQPWNEVLKINSNCEMAYRGIGQAMLKTGDYKQAVEYFKLGYDRENESKAFDKYRAQVLRQNFGIVMFFIFVVAVFLFIITNYKIRRKIAAKLFKRNGRGGRK